MRVVYMGTPELAARVLDGLAERHEVALVLTRPDAVSGRGNKRRPSAVKARALELGIDVLEADTMDEGVLEALSEAAPEAICVAAFGRILPDAVLELPRHGCLNVHMSLLPRWRGAAPIERAMLAGDAEVGFSIMRMESGLDTGAYCRQGAIPVDGRYLDELEEELGRTGAQALSDVLDELESGPVEWIEQDEALVTYAEKIGKNDLSLDPAVTAAENQVRVRASSEAHPSRTTIAGRDVRIERATCNDSIALDTPYELGTALFIQKKLLLVCAEGVLEVEQLRPSGKNSMDAKAFCAGIQNFKNEPKRWGDIA